MVRLQLLGLFGLRNVVCTIIVHTVKYMYLLCIEKKKSKQVIYVRCTYYTIIVNILFYLQQVGCIAH